LLPSSFEVQTPLAYLDLQYDIAMPADSPVFLGDLFMIPCLLRLSVGTLLAHFSVLQKANGAYTESKIVSQMPRFY